MTKEEKDIMFEMLDIMEDMAMVLHNITSSRVIEDRISKVWSKLNGMHDKENKREE